MTNKLNIVVCDDDLDFVEKFSKKIQALFKFNAIETNIDIIVNPVEFIEEMNKTYAKKYDIAFLDIEMPKINGVSIAKKINAERKQTKIIFVTNKDNYIFDLQDIKHIWFVRKSHLDCVLSIESLANELKKLCSCQRENYCIRETQSVIF